MPSSSGSGNREELNNPEGQGSIPGGVQGPGSGTQQGPPCSSPEECARMFGPK